MRFGPGKMCGDPKGELVCVCVGRRALEAEARKTFVRL